MARSTLIFGRKLRAAREFLSITQTELGERIGEASDGEKMSDENIGRIERSEVAGILTKKLPALAKALGWTLEKVRAELVVPEDYRANGQSHVAVKAMVTPEARAWIKAAAEPEAVDVADLAGQLIEEAIAARDGTGQKKAGAAPPAAKGGHGKGGARRAAGA